MMTGNPDFFLAPSEGYDMEQPRRCWRVKRMRTASRDDLLLVKIDPPLPDNQSKNGDLIFIVVAPRHKGSSLFPIQHWPVFVHVAKLNVPTAVATERIAEAHLELIGWAELYKSEKDAKNSAQ